VIIQSEDTCIWTDPWLFSKAFNNSWTLWPPAAFDPALLDHIQWLWLSHEHPDHMNFPTLASLPDAFKQRVTVLFQDNRSDRIFEPLRGIGYSNFRVLHHRDKVRLSDFTQVYCYRVGTIDSCLAVLSDGQVIFNANDVRLNRADARRILRDIGPSDVVLNQFSTAVYRGHNAYARYLPIVARHMLETLSADHANLRAKVTIPFASFMYFSTVDNHYMNEYANRVHDVADFCKARNQRIAVLYPGDEYIVGAPHDSTDALRRFDELYSQVDRMTYDEPPVVQLDIIVEAFHALVKKLHEHYPSVILRLLRPLRVKIPDLNMVVRMSVRDDKLDCLPPDSPADIVIYSQPLHYSFVYTWGLHTLTSSARVLLERNILSWKMHKGLFALNNANVYLRPRFLFGFNNLKYAIERLRGAIRYTDRSRAWVHPSYNSSAPRHRPMGSMMVEHDQMSESPRPAL
jgi:UDP-MurNAc hydroxylase